MRLHLKISLLLTLILTAISWSAHAGNLCDLLSFKEVEKTTEIKSLQCKPVRFYVTYCDKNQEKECGLDDSVLIFKNTPDNLDDLEYIRKSAEENAKAASQYTGKKSDPKISKVDDLGLRAIYYGTGRQLQWVIAKNKGFTVQLGGKFKKSDDETQKKVLTELAKSVTEQAK